MDKISSIEVIIEDLSKHPYCAHGPTLLFSRSYADTKRKFYACAACRDRKDCSFFVWHDELNKVSGKDKTVWKEKLEKKVKLFNHRKLFLQLNKIKQVNESKRSFCHNCSVLLLDDELTKHSSHNVTTGISDYLLQHPSELLKPKDNSKLEAQYLFSEPSVTAIINILNQLNLKHIVCIGTPRIHESIQEKHVNEGMSSILLDLDERYHSFFGPLEYCWYNSFNHYFFGGESSRSVFEDFLQTNNGQNIAIITDPPFGGRVEPLADGIQKITKKYQSLNSITDDLPVIWVFPYFMESQIQNSLPNYKMLDYKVDYENHSLFTEKAKGRKYGSPVRIFTNVSPKKIPLPESEGYKYCKKCERWISIENKHCKICKECTSKDGRTYIHCAICVRCVKPSWQHCETCKRCCLPTHKCGEFVPSQECFHCKCLGHKKRDCPKLELIKDKKKRKSDHNPDVECDSEKIKKKKKKKKQMS